MEKLRVLVEAGAAPRHDLEKAEDRIADAEDEAFLRKTLYGPDLTAEQAGDMIAAAGRRFERRKTAYDDAKKLVDAGVAPSFRSTRSSAIWIWRGKSASWPIHAPN